MTRDFLDGDGSLGKEERGCTGALRDVHGTFSADFDELYADIVGP